MSESVNPFGGYGIPVQGERFVGRARELAKLVERLSAAHSSMSIIGLPRIGKTSLVKETLNRLRRNRNENEPLQLMIAVSVSVFPDSRSLLVGLGEEIAERLSAGSPALAAQILSELTRPAINSYEAFRNLRSILRMLKSESVRSVVVLDEFDAIRSFTDSNTLVQQLRELICTWDSTGLSLIFVSRRPIFMIERQLEGVSTLDGVCEKLWIGPLCQENIVQMFQRIGSRIPNAECHQEQVWNYVGGHPFLTEMILCKAWDRSSLPEGMEEAAGEMFDHYEHLRTLLAEDGLLDQILQATIGPRWSLQMSALETLRRYGLLVLDDHDILTRPGTISESFEVYLEKIAREVPIWPIWRETEINLRYFIENTLSKSLGAEWEDKTVSRHPKSLSKVFEDCRDKKRREEGNLRGYASGRVLDYAYPMQLWDIMAAEWPFFSTLLNHDKPYWRERFQAISMIRTSSAHSRDHLIPEERIMIAKGYCMELLQKLKEVARKSDFDDHAEPGDESSSSTTTE